MTFSYDIVGHVFGRYTVIAKSPRAGTHSYWVCRCACGNERTVRGDSLLCGHSGSCGCLCAEVSSKKARTHGRTKTTEYKTWQGMRSRCDNARDHGYPRYGGRGIRVCQRWRTSFEQFFADMGPKPSPTHSLDRINNDGDYEPRNCRWASKATQSRNRGSNRLLTLNGETKPLIEWAEAIGVTHRTLTMRLLNKWPIEKALTTPLQSRRINL
jgi:hypothetical protein